MQPDVRNAAVICESAREIELVDAIRRGDRSAFGVLYERYEPLAYRFACKLLGTVQGAEDLVAEAFAKVFERIISGGGPITAFRSYLLTTVRTTWYKQLAGDRMIDRQADLSDLALATFDRDMIEDRLDVMLVARAFASLPQRWQTVLWHLQVENESTAAVAELLNIQPNAVAALAFRARDALRIAYLQMHVNTAVDQPCREVADNLAAWLCGRLNRNLRIRIERHLAYCGRCLDSAVEVGGLLTEMRRMLPLTAGRSAAVLYLDDIRASLAMDALPQCPVQATRRPGELRSAHTGLPNNTASAVTSNRVTPVGALGQWRVSGSTS